MTTDKTPLQRMLEDLAESQEEQIEEIENQLLDNLIYGTPLPGQEPTS